MISLENFLSEKPIYCVEEGTTFIFQKFCVSEENFCNYDENTLRNRYFEIVHFLFHYDYQQLCSFCVVQYPEQTIHSKNEKDEDFVPSNDEEAEEFDKKQLDLMDKNDQKKKRKQKKKIHKVQNKKKNRYRIKSFILIICLAMCFFVINSFPILFGDLF